MRSLNKWNKASKGAAGDIPQDKDKNRVLEDPVQDHHEKAAKAFSDAMKGIA